MKQGSERPLMRIADSPKCAEVARHLFSLCLRHRETSVEPSVAPAPQGQEVAPAANHSPKTASGAGSPESGFECLGETPDATQVQPRGHGRKKGMAGLRRLCGLTACLIAAQVGLLAGLLECVPESAHTGYLPLRPDSGCSYARGPASMEPTRGGGQSAKDHHGRSPEGTDSYKESRQPHSAPSRGTPQQGKEMGCLGGEDQEGVRQEQEALRRGPRQDRQGLSRGCLRRGAGCPEGAGLDPQGGSGLAACSAFDGPVPGTRVGRDHGRGHRRGAGIFPDGPSSHSCGACRPTGCSTTSESGSGCAIAHAYSRCSGSPSLSHAFRHPPAGGQSSWGWQHAYLFGRDGWHRSCCIRWLPHAEFIAGDAVSGGCSEPHESRRCAHTKEWNAPGTARSKPDAGSHAFGTAAQRHQGRHQASDSSRPGRGLPCGQARKSAQCYAGLSDAAFRQAATTSAASTSGVGSFDQRGHRTSSSCPHLGGRRRGAGNGVTRTHGLLTDAFSAHGYTLSFGPSKTAAVVAVRGKGSRGVRRALFGGDAKISILREEAGAASLPLVPTYRHLGVQVAAAGGILPEIKQRVALAWAAFRQGRTRVFRSKRIAMAKRGALLATHVLTKLLFASGAWPALGKGELTLFTHTVLSLYRQTLIVGPDGDQHLTHATVCALIQQPPPAVLLLVEQARYLLQLFQSAPTGLWALLRRDPPYIVHLRSVVSWLYGWVCNTTDLPDPLETWAPWAHLLTQRPGLYKAYVKRARGLEMARTTGLAALQALRRALQQLVCGIAVAATQPGDKYDEGCLQCKIAFASRTAWACHASKIHGYGTAATLLAAEVARPTCTACGKLFASRGRLQRHLLGSEACRLAWGSFELRPGQDTAAAVHSQAPPAQLLGRKGGHAFQHDPAEVHLGLLKELQESTTDSPDTFWEVVSGYIAPLGVLRRTVDVWGRHPGCSQDAADVARIAGDLLLLLDVELWCEDFRAPRQPRTPLDCCPPLDPPGDGKLCFHLSGCLQVFDIDAPPTKDFCYPFRGSVPLAAARRTVAWLEAACDILGAAVQATQQSPVLIRSSPTALAALEPAVSWLIKGGFIVVSGGLRSPFG